jgi:hypothetical protein
MLLPSPATVQAILQTVLVEEGSAVCDPELAELLTREMLQKLTHMPRVMGLGVAGLTILFDLSSLVKTGRRFHLLDKSAQAEKLNRWKHARVGLFREVMELYEKMGIFIFYSLKEGG